MKLYIQEKQWAQNRVRGERTARITYDEVLPAEVGVAADLAVSVRSCTVDALTAKSLTLTLHDQRNPAADKTFILPLGEEVHYMPTSFGAGYIYRFLYK